MSAPSPGSPYLFPPHARPHTALLTLIYDSDIPCYDSFYPPPTIPTASDKFLRDRGALLVTYLPVVPLTSVCSHVSVVRVPYLLSPSVVYSVPLRWVFGVHEEKYLMANCYHDAVAVNFWKDERAGKSGKSVSASKTK